MDELPSLDLPLEPMALEFERLVIMHPVDNCCFNPWRRANRSRELCGRLSFGNLNPGSYTLTIKRTGFRNVERNHTVVIGMLRGLVAI